MNELEHQTHDVASDTSAASRRGTPGSTGADAPRKDRVSAARNLAAPLLLGVLPVLVLVLALTTYSRNGTLAIDFHHELYPEAELVARGTNPYPASDAEITDTTNNVWPVAVVAPLIPLTVLPANVADWTATVLVLAALAGALWLVGVRDWRVYGAALLWAPVINGIQTANLTIPLCVLLAAAWRTRAHRWAPGLAVGAALSAKFFLWPLAIWLLAIRRPVAAAVAVVLAAASLLALLPFIGIWSYVELLRNLSDTFDQSSYTLYALLVDAGTSSPLARTLTIAAGCAVLALAWKRRSLALFVGAALILSPIVWLHFFALLVVPVALTHPRFDLAWLVPLPLWLVPGTGNGDPWQTAVALLVLAATLIACERPTLVHARRRTTAHIVEPHWI
jgi:hypothetical protein